MSGVLHLVLLGWKPTTSESDRAEVVDGVRGLPDRIPGIRALHEGPSVSPEGLEQGHDYAFAMMFESTAARDAYLPHPAHLEVASRIQAAADRVTVFDLDAGDESVVLGSAE
ncbi:stress responsive alpha/beta barrel protein [Diaminobutyricimonas aerilata]|uniref:Stress responsive alpha/beta barrel protein n=1 Tax=Diaminobutyricimonas aerilata TaxID=1162967 RepID=A0A2M9CFZ2_9MICO|nr:Dabb family protein [Diaminobutyricimonas aerilata]PJJ70856.1 stress responsive alpha/beta barrel protein [Diaminobutyricimonas aerilata]